MRRVGLITENKRLIKLCTEILKKRGSTTVVVAANIPEFRAKAGKTPIHGLLIEMKLFLRAESDDRWFVNSLSEFMPLAKIRFVEESDDIIGLLDSAPPTPQGFLQHFGNVLARKDKGFHLRRFERRPAILNVQLFHKFWGKKPLRANTSDISPGGLFILASEYPPLESKLQLTILEMPGSPKIEVEVRWELPWGKSNTHFSGFGVEFRNLTGKLSEAIAKL